MPKILTVGNEEFEFPLTGENAGYGSEVTDWAVAVTDALSTVQKPNDIPTTSEISLDATQLPSASPAPIPGFSFPTVEVIAIEAKYLFRREYVIGVQTFVEMEVGFIEGYFNGQEWGIAIRTTGDAGVSITIDEFGQMRYRVTKEFPSESSAPSRKLSIVYEAKVINK